MAALLGAALLAGLLYAVQRYKLKPSWPAVGYAVVFTAMLFLSRSGSISNVAGGVSAGMFCYLLFRLTPEIVSGVGKWGLVFATFIVPAVAVMIANKVTTAIDALWVAAGKPGS